MSVFFRGFSLSPIILKNDLELGQVHVLAHCVHDKHATKES